MPRARHINHFSAMMSLEKRAMKVQNLKPFSPFVFCFALACERMFIKTHSTESRCVIGPENMQARPCSFQQGNFTGSGSEGVNNRLKKKKAAAIYEESVTQGQSMKI